MSTYTTYYSVFVTCLKLMSNVFSVHQRTCLISHTSAYVGAIRRSVTGPLHECSYFIDFIKRVGLLFRNEFNKFNDT